MSEHGLRLCSDCKHQKLDDEEWCFCERPNYPDGKNWNTCCFVQRYSDDMIFCGGRYWQAKT